MKDLTFCLLHSIFSKKRSRWKKRRDCRAEYQASELSARNRDDIDKIRAGLPDESFHLVGFTGSLHATVNTHWAFVLKMPPWNRSHKQVTRSPLGKWHSAVATWLY